MLTTKQQVNYCFHWFAKAEVISQENTGTRTRSSEGAGQGKWHHVVITVHTQHSRGQWSEATGSTMKSCRAPPTICFFHRCNWRRAHNTKQQKKVGHNPTVLTRSPRYWLFFHLFFLFLFTALYLVSDTVDWKTPTVKTYESLRIGVSNIS